MATIRKRGERWQVQIRRKGCSPISKTFVLKKDADLWARKTEAQVDRSEFPLDKEQFQSLTLKELVCRYKDEITPRKKGYSQETYRLNAFVRHPICQTKVMQVSTSDFAQYRDDRLQLVTPKSLKTELAPIHNLFEIARDEWGIPIAENPLDKLRLKFVDQRRERRLKEGELDRIINEAQKCRNPYIVPVILFAVETAMRRGEILGVRWSHIDWKHRSVAIPVSKNGYSRVIHLTPKALKILEEVRKGISNGIGISVGTLNPCSPYSKALCGTGENRKERSHKSLQSDTLILSNTFIQSDTIVFPITANALRLNWERLKKRAGIEDLHFHDLRHEAISRFFEMGLTVPEVALISGHRDTRMLLRYAHRDSHRVREKLANRSS